MREASTRVSRPGRFMKAVITPLKPAMPSPAAAIVERLSAGSTVANRIAQVFWYVPISS